MKTHYRSGTRIPTGATIEATGTNGAPLRFDVESKLPVPVHVGGGYGGDSDWSELVRALRAAFATWEAGERLDFRGEHYRHT